jgi:hypothetical protein
MSSQIEDDAEKENLNQSQGDAMKTTIISVGCQNMNGSTQNVQIVIGHPNPENHPDAKRHLFYPFCLWAQSRIQ